MTSWVDCGWSAVDIIVLDPLELAVPYSSPLNHRLSMSFVKLSIFGTSFEVGFLLLSFISLTRSQVTTRYVDLQPVGMGV